MLHHPYIRSILQLFSCKQYISQSLSPKVRHHFVNHHHHRVPIHLLTRSDVIITLIPKDKNNYRKKAISIINPSAGRKRERK